MPKQLLILSFILISYTINNATAQEPPKHKWDIGAEISSPEDFSTPNEVLFTAIDNGTTYSKKDNYAFSMGVLGCYYLKNDIFVRLRVTICNRKITVHSDNLGDTASSTFSRDETRQQSSGTLVLGLGKNIVEQKFIRANIGLELSTTFFGNYTDDYSANEMAGFGGDIWLTNNFYTVSGGYAIRLGPFVGGQFVFLKNFSVGPEISFAFQYYKTGGEATQHSIGVDTNNSTNNFDYYTPNQSTIIQGTGFSKIKAIMRMSYSF